jgi:tRNA threonylcarbamoyladenosine biosynthesis protein TsaE
MSAAAELVLASYSPEETFGIAMELGALLHGGETLALQGELGSGKTLFTKGLCAGLGVADPRGVASPTYVLEHVYEGSVPIHHYDVYRLASSDEFLALGFEEHLGGSDIIVIEWADRVASVLPPDRLEVRLELRGEDASAGETPSTEAPEPPDSRTITFSGPATTWQDRLDRLSRTHSGARS